MAHVQLRTVASKGMQACRIRCHSVDVGELMAMSIPNFSIPPMPIFYHFTLWSDGPEISK